jgi:hypothetical protein
MFMIGIGAFSPGLQEKMADFRLESSQMNSLETSERQAANHALRDRAPTFLRH